MFLATMQRVIRHPKYNPAERGGYDVALIQLDKSIKGVKFVQLATKATVSSHKHCYACQQCCAWQAWNLAGLPPMQR